MLGYILSAIIGILFVIYLIREHTWYQIALLGIVMIVLGLAEEFTNWELDFWSSITGGLILMVLNLKVILNEDED